MKAPNTEQPRESRWPKWLGWLRPRWPRFRRTRAMLNRQPPKRRAMYIMLIAAAILFGGIFAWKMFWRIFFGIMMSSGYLPPATVSTIVVHYEMWQPQIQTVGTLHAVNGADLSVELPGVVQDVDFNSGDDVAAGAVLIRLKADDDIGRLNSLQAAADLAAVTYARDQKQVQVHAISQAALDASAANLRSAKAQVVEQQAVVDKKTIKAPFAGRTGIRYINVGQYVNAGTVAVTLQVLDPIYLDFFLPQQALARIKNGQQVTVKVDTYPADTFTGTLTAIDPKVDPQTRNVAVRATLENPTHKLLPGMYASAEITAGAKQRYLTVPQTAITFNPYGSTVYVAQNTGTKDAPKLVAKQTFVTTGDTRGDQIAILGGVKEGDTIVSAGQLKLQNSTPLVINNSIQPTNNPHPTPSE